MQTNLAQWALDTELGNEADDILRRCVHCGFCLATCPTYQITGDERDSPRGRIYLIKQMLEGNPVTQATQHHLDRCLTCRNCETTCPSGVEYGKLVDIGRGFVEERVQRPLGQRVQRFAVRSLVNSALFDPAIAIGRLVRPALPEALRSKVPVSRPQGTLPEQPQTLPRQMLMLAGCVQPAMIPAIDAATQRVLAHLGIGTRVAPTSGCCGAVNFHLDKQDAALIQMRANIDAWLPLLQSGAVEAIVINASGCGAMVHEYAHHFRHDPIYGPKSAELLNHVLDISQVVAPHAAELREHISKLPQKSVFHPPCTLQHWQDLRELTETLLGDLGFDLRPFEESHLCCGAAGTYSITQPELATQLRDRKLNAIEQAEPDTIMSSNIGCITHLQAGSTVPVRHWIEIVDQALSDTKHRVLQEGS